MNRIFRMTAGILITGAALVLLTTTSTQADEKSGPVLATLLHAQLEGVDSTEVILSRVEVPPSTQLARHYHPGEEFIYVLEGSGTVTLKGQPPVQLQPGDVFKVPLQHVHSARSGDAGMKAIVFRVHRTGQPERIPVTTAETQ
ncbi:MAG: cupin domain-containing protein [Gemmatimonadetes bacterium]|jgi:quercetin dioxygenase-like cupin family protein|nr:cupin domain-containing protein [Gemmatimonadota bacterium]MBT6147447.1 cupin domain-containing protein [Gemmatimonadota bacterium]MBT7859590.1 cupin domain-containing protein [Gemmatimonadota bacterium]